MNMDTWATLSPGARTYFHASYGVGFCAVDMPVIMLGAAGLYSLLGVPGRIVIGLGVVAVIIAIIETLVMPLLVWSRWAWWLRRHDLLVSRGVFIKTLEAVPRARVQHVDINQGIVAKMFGVVDLTVKTASGGVRIRALEPAIAEALRDALVDVRGDDGV